MCVRTLVSFEHVRGIKQDRGAEWSNVWCGVTIKRSGCEREVDVTGRDTKDTILNITPGQV